MSGTSTWAAAALAADVRARFQASFRALGADARRRCVGWLLGGGAACAAVSGGLALAGRKLLSDESAPVRRFAEAGILDFQQALFLSQPGSTALILPLAVIGAWIAVRHDRPREALALLATALGTKVIVGVGWLVWARDRPELVEGGLAAPLGLSSFPSGHMAQTVAFYALATWLWHRRSRSVVERAIAWALCAALAAATAAARLRLGAHWPSDLVAGAVVGALWAWACARVMRS